MLSLALLLAAQASTGAPESLEARAAARTCLSAEAPAEESLEGCRRAVALGLPAGWSAALRAFQARRLAALGRWDEAIEIYRALADEQPADASWPLRLGSALLFGVDRKEDAQAALREALSRDSRRAAAWALLGAALLASGHREEASASFARARELDPDSLDARPAMLESEEAARRGGSWP